MKYTLAFTVILIFNLAFSLDKIEFENGKNVFI